MSSARRCLGCWAVVMAVDSDMCRPVCGQDFGTSVSSPGCWCALHTSTYRRHSPRRAPLRMPLTLSRILEIPMASPHSSS